MKLISTLVVAMMGLGWVLFSFAESASSTSSPSNSSNTIVQGVNSAPVSQTALDVPNYLNDASDSAEALYNAAKNGNWMKVKQQLGSLESAIQQISISDQAASEIKLERLLSILKNEIANKAQSSVMRDANKITHAVAEMKNNYISKMPADIDLLSSYGRELETWANTNQLAKLKETQLEIQDLWIKLRPKIIAQGVQGQAEVNTFDGYVRRVEHAKTIADFKQIVPLFLDEIDKLKQTFGS